MPEQFLHGIEIVELSTGLRPISTVKSSIIALVGTAPAAEADTKASATIGTGNAAILVTSKAVGVLGNTTSIRLVAPTGANAALGVVVTGNAIVVNLATGATAGVVTSTATQIIAAIVASAPANALIQAVNASGSTGAGVASGMTFEVTLSGGANEPFPMNSAVLITGPRMAARLGEGGTLKDAYMAVYSQGVNAVLIVRVANGANEAATLANVVGSSALSTGLWALLHAENRTGLRPRILAAPGFTSTPAASPASPVTLGLISVANRLRSVVIADGPNTTEADAVTDRGKFGSDRLFIVDPAVRVFDSVSSSYVTRPASAYVAGALSASDASRGFWWSPSNQLLAAVSGTDRPIDWDIGSTETEANRLNEAGIATIIRKDGFRLWGNRSTASDPLWAFLSVRRTADMVYESVQAAHLWAMDRPFSPQLLIDIRDSVQAYLDTLKIRGALLGGQVWIDPELNTEATMKAGKLYIDFDIEPPAPLEHLTFQVRRNGDYYEELVASVSTAA